MSRKYTINPYTIVPLNNKTSFKGSATDDIHHLWFEEEKFTGKIHVRLTFVTPVVIPGKLKGGIKGTQPGEICLYRHNGQLAIPGSRLRGHILNLMRAINSSPIVHYEDRQILNRVNNNNVGKGFVTENEGKLYVQELENEYLVAHNDRINKSNIRLKNGLNPTTNALIYTETKQCGIPINDDHKYDPSKKLDQGVKGTIYCSKSNWKPYGPRTYVCNYSDNLKTEKICGNKWVVFDNLTGQDGKNQLKDTTGNKKAHLNRWHVAKLEDCDKKYELTDEIIAGHANSVKEMARLARDREEDKAEGNKLAADILEGLKLKPGDFVYFEQHDNKIVSIGRHYHYLYRKDSVREKIDKVNSPLGPADKCLVGQIAGWANEKGEGMKSRIWVEMATIDPTITDEIIEEKKLIERKNLRILSSQPPKSKFYDRAARKFYWNDPLWKKKMWDNEDMKNGDHAFENPEPGNKKLWAQWSQAEVLMANKDTPVSFDFVIRLFNATENEKHLLLSALLGFSTKEDSLIKKDNGIVRNNWEKWCHKIGHARPFIGSAYMKVIRMEEIQFSDKTWRPILETCDLSKNKACEALVEWQENIKGPHKNALTRIMDFNGAYVGLEEDEKKMTRMTYPLGQRQPKKPKPSVYPLTELDWNRNEKERPKTFHWFSNNKNTSLPDLSPNNKQVLKVYVEPYKEG